MKALKRSLCLVAAVVMMMGLVACGSEEGIVGTWVDNVNGVDNIITFNKDNTMKMEIKDVMNIDGTYTSTADSIDVVIMGQTVHYTYKLNDKNTLAMTVNDETETFKRK